jgi:hypothetical protein
MLLAHSSEQLQPLELDIFAVGKCHVKWSCSNENLNIQTVQFIKILGG